MSAGLEKELQTPADATKNSLLRHNKSRNLDSILGGAVVFPQPARLLTRQLQAAYGTATRNAAWKVCGEEVGTPFPLCCCRR